MENNLKKNIYIYIYLNHFAVLLKLTQHCKLTIFQFRKATAEQSRNPALPQPGARPILHSVLSALLCTTKPVPPGTDPTAFRHMSLPACVPSSIRV